MPAASIRVMDEQAFRSGRKNSQEGGPKGIDFDRSMTVLATTCEHQALQFLDAAAVLAAAPSGSPAMDVEYELGVLEIAARHKARAQRAVEAEASATARAKAAERRMTQAGAARAPPEKAGPRSSRPRLHSLKEKAARAKARGGFVIGGRPWRLTAPLSWLYYAIKRSN